MIIRNRKRETWKASEKYEKKRRSDFKKEALAPTSRKQRRDKKREKSP